MVKGCKHNWKKVYYRKVIEGRKYQDWLTIPNTFVCDKCVIIKKLRK